MLVFIRITLGLFFLLMGGSKLLAPYQNFLYVIQNYQVFSPPLDELAARIVPWIEFFLGLFLLIGLWLKPTLIVLLTMISGFLVILGQAMIRKLPITSCGCFGEWLSVPMPVMFLIDSSLWLFTFFMLRRLSQTSQVSLDNYFLAKN